MNPNTLQTVKIFLLMFLMLILITSQTAFSQTLHSSLHNYTASQRIDGDESGKVSFFFISACHTLLSMFGPKVKVGVNSQPCWVALCEKSSPPQLSHLCPSLIPPPNDNAALRHPVFSTSIVLTTQKKLQDTLNIILNSFLASIILPAVSKYWLFKVTDRLGDHKDLDLLCQIWVHFQQ